MTSNHIYDVVISNHDKLFETIKEATEYCDHHNISRATIRQYEHQEEYDEDGFLEEIWNFDDWTYPLKNKKKKEYLEFNNMSILDFILYKMRTSKRNNK